MQKNKKLSTTTLTLMCVAAIASLRNLPLMASVGVEMFFFYGVAVIGFFIPVGLFVSELSTNYPSEGGMYAWARQAFGLKVGFLTTWFFTARCIATYIPILAFTSGTLSYLIDPTLAQNRLYITVTSIVLFWGCTLMAFKGTKMFQSLGNFSTLAGTVLPAIFIVGLSCYWVISGQTCQLNFQWNALIPKITNINQLTLLAGTFLAFGGMEVAAVYTKQVDNPKITFPKATRYATILVLLISVLGSLSVAVIVPQAALSLNSGIIQTFSYIFNALHLQMLVPVCALMLVLGAISALGINIMSAVGSLVIPAKQEGALPPFFQKCNANGAPTNLLITQALIVTGFCLLFLVIPSINLAFWIFTAVATSIYVLVYIVMLAAGITLRYKHRSVPTVSEGFRIPGGFFGICCVGGLGIISSTLCFVLGFITPEHFSKGTSTLVNVIQVSALVLLSLPPFFLLALRKPEWKQSIESAKID